MELKGGLFGVRFEPALVKRELTGKHFVYILVDGVHSGVRPENASQLHLVEKLREACAVADGSM